MFNSDTKTVKIQETDNHKLYLQTLLHEFGHCVLHEAALDETSVADDVQEIIVEQIAKALVNNFEIKPKGGK